MLICIIFFLLRGILLKVALSSSKTSAQHIKWQNNVVMISDTDIFLPTVSVQRQHTFHVSSSANTDHLEHPHTYVYIFLYQQYQMRVFVLCYDLTKIFLNAVNLNLRFLYAIISSSNYLTVKTKQLMILSACAYFLT